MNNKVLPFTEDQLRTIVREEAFVETKDVFTTKQAADYLMLSPQRLEIWRSEGGGPLFCKIGRSVRYMRKDIDAWLEKNRRTNTIKKSVDGYDCR